ncbi:hypothetical protein, partial [Streptomyces sp. 150FB]|uniref:hypothetical protein n=1 Tax=Streptomyces sp. 150FB TaxID=1576605 RepID=UPI003221BFFC
GGASRARTVRRAAAALLLAVCAAGCGIRTTSVPVDEGAAPSRVPCDVGKKDTGVRAAPGEPVRVYLMCASELRPVERTVHSAEHRTPAELRVFTQELVDQLQAQPSTAETQAGFSSYVRGPLAVDAPHRGDPADTTRLSRQPEDLPTEALAQIVCTFKESGATSGTVLLGGPGDYPARPYICDQEIKHRPDSAVPTLSPTPSET